MARRRKPRRPPSGNATAPIRFANLDGSDASNQMLGDDADDEFVDPLDSEPGLRDIDPREDEPLPDPFADDADDDVAFDDAADPAEDEAEDAAGEGDDDPDEPEEDAKSLREQLAAERARLAALEREREQERQERDEARKSLTEAKAKQIDDDLAATEVALERAIEEGETKKQVELYRRLAKLEADKQALASQPAQETRQATSAAPVLRPNNAAAEAWMRGKPWINSPAHVAQNEEVLRIAKILVEDGYDPAKPDYYEELERRHARKYPELATPKKAAPKSNGQRVRPVSRDDPPQRRPANSRVVTLTAADKQNMMRFGLDPENKAHLREYAKNKVA